MALHGLEGDGVLVVSGLDVLRHAAVRPIRTDDHVHLQALLHAFPGIALDPEGGGNQPKYLREGDR